MKNKELRDTVELMNSADYVDRFKAEYYQTKIRHEKLVNMIVLYREGMLKFTPKCSIETFSLQALLMKAYLNVLLMRAEIEGIEL